MYWIHFLPSLPIVDILNNLKCRHDWTNHVRVCVNLTNTTTVCFTLYSFWQIKSSVGLFLRIQITMASCKTQFLVCCCVLSFCGYILSFAVLYSTSGSLYVKPCRRQAMWLVVACYGWLHRIWFFGNKTCYNIQLSFAGHKVKVW